MAILHHYVINCLCGVKVSNYALVGDDLAFRGTDTQFANYLRLMREIGVDVNLSKTIISSREDEHIEFARNYILQGVKVVPLQFGTLFA